MPHMECWFILSKAGLRSIITELFESCRRHISLHDATYALCLLPRISRQFIEVADISTMRHEAHGTMPYRFITALPAHAAIAADI